MKRSKRSPSFVTNLDASAGFTIIELIMAIIIVGFLMGVMLINFPASQKRARDLKRQDDLKQYLSSLGRYAINTDGVYPIHTSTVGLTTLCPTLGLTGSSCPDDSKAPTQHYNYQSSADGVSFAIWASIEITPGDIWIVCSNGLSGEAVSTSTPTTGNCPLGDITPTPTGAVTATPVPPTSTPAATSTPSPTSSPTATPTSSGPVTVTLYPTDDSFVDSTIPAQNFGLNTRLDARASAPERISYTKFNLTPYAGRTAASATLRLRRCASGCPAFNTQVNVFQTGTAWTELTINYSNRPIDSGLIATIPGATFQGEWQNVGVTSFVSSNMGNIIAMSYHTPIASFTFFSSGETTDSPNLVIVYY